MMTSRRTRGAKSVRVPERKTVKYDVFISYASEDKDTVVRLAAELKDAGLKVWLDEDQLPVGVDLKPAIDQGIASSKYAVVIVSQHYIRKPWPRLEFGKFMERAKSGRKVFLPVLHDVTPEQVERFSRPLAAKRALSTKSGIPALAKSILSEFGIARSTSADQGLLVLKIPGPYMDVYLTGDSFQWEKSIRLRYQRESDDGPYALSGISHESRTAFKHFVVSRLEQREAIAGQLMAAGFEVTGGGSRDDQPGSWRIWFLLRDYPIVGVGVSRNNQWP